MNKKETFRIADVSETNTLIVMLRLADDKLANLLRYQEVARIHPTELGYSQKELQGDIDELRMIIEELEARLYGLDNE